MHKIPICRPIMDEEMTEAAVLALQNEMSVGGESVFKFEEEFASYTGVKHAVSVSSGTDALILSLIAAGIKDKKVVTTPFTFIASCNSIIHAGGHAVLADIDERDCNIDPEKVAAVTDDSVGALLPVHIFGRPCRMDEMMDIAAENDALVIEDACQAHGATFKGKKVGSIGDIGCFSFYPTKNMTVGGDGGMVTTDDGDLASSIRKLRDCGRKERYLHDVHGFTSRLNSVNAAIGRVQLRRLDSWNSMRIVNSQLYHKHLSGIEGLSLPLQNGLGMESVFHLYAVRTERRDELKKWLDDNGVATAIHYPVPVHRQPVFEPYGMGNYPLSEKASMTSISLPMFPGLSSEDISIVCDHIKDFFGRFG